MLQESLVALITPLQGAALDWDAYARLIAWQVESGTAGLVPCGTTGESPTLTEAEHLKCIEIAVDVAARRVPVIAGTGSNSTAHAIFLTQEAKRRGADAALVVTPYYNKPTQEGLYRHYLAIADEGGLPVLIYNIPSRSVVDMLPATMARLARHPNILGVKDATANLARPIHTRRACGPDFVQLSGEDPTALAFRAAGGAGCISVTANIAPKLCAQMHAAWTRGDTAAAIALQDQLMPLHDALFAETSPGPVKHGAALLGYGDGTCRLPLAPIAPETASAVETAMRALHLLPP